MSSAAVSTKSSGRKTKAVAAPVAAETVPVVVPAVVEVVAEPAVVAAAAPHTRAERLDAVTELGSIVELATQARNAQAALYTKLKQFEKQLPRDLKNAQKHRRQAKAVDPDAPKKETTFMKPAPITDALCVFMGLPKGSTACRSDVTKRVCAYAKEKGLMSKQDINADSTLIKLLGLKETDKLNILNLQKFLKHLYIKNAPTAAAGATASA